MKGKAKRIAAFLLGVCMACCPGGFVSRADMLPEQSTAQNTPAMREITSQQLVEEMGLGYDFGNGLDSAGDWISKESPYVYERGWGNPNINQTYIRKIKEAGFKTVRVPVTWSYWIDENNQIDPAWMARVKEVVDWCLEEDLHVILNIHHEGEWIQQFPEKHDWVMKRYTDLWRQISAQFQDYPDYLIFESMNEIGFDSVPDTQAFQLCTELNQAFVDLIRSSGGNNPKRHLLIAGYWTDPGKSCDERYIMPNDPAGRCMLSIHYYSPTDFTGDWGDDVDWTTPRGTWGSQDDYLYTEKMFRLMADRWVKNGVPIIIGEYGASTSERKERESVVRFDKYVAETALKYGMCPVLWDDSNSGAIMLTDRNTGEFYWPELKQVYQELSAKLEAGQVSRDGYNTSMYAQKSVKVKDNGELELGDIAPSKIRGMRFRIRCSSDWDGMGGGAIFFGDWNNTPSYQFDTLGQEVWITFDDETRNKFGNTLQILIWWCNSDDGIDHKSELYLDKSSVKVLFDPGTDVGQLNRTFAAGGGSGGGGGSSSGGTTSGNTPVGNKDSLGQPFKHIIRKDKFTGDEPPSKQFEIKDYLPEYEIGDKVKITIDARANGGYAAAIQANTPEGWTQSEQWGSNDSQVNSYTCIPTDGKASVILWYMDADWFMFNVRVEMVEKMKPLEKIVSITKDDISEDGNSWVKEIDISSYLPEGIKTGDRVTGYVIFDSSRSTDNYGSVLRLGDVGLQEWFCINEGRTQLSFTCKPYTSNILKIIISCANLSDTDEIKLMDIHLEKDERYAVIQGEATEENPKTTEIDISGKMADAGAVAGSSTVTLTLKAESDAAYMGKASVMLADGSVKEVEFVNGEALFSSVIPSESKVTVTITSLEAGKTVEITDITVVKEKDQEAIARITASDNWEKEIDVTGYLPDGLEKGDRLTGYVTLASSKSTGNYGSQLTLDGTELHNWYIVEEGTTKVDFEKKSYPALENKMKIVISADNLSDGDEIRVMDIHFELAPIATATGGPEITEENPKELLIPLIDYTENVDTNRELTIEVSARQQPAGISRAAAQGFAAAAWVLDRNNQKISSPFIDGKAVLTGYFAENAVIHIEVTSLAEGQILVISRIDIRIGGIEGQELALPYLMTETNRDGNDWKVTIPFAKLGVEGIKEGEKVNATVTYKPNTENSGATLIIFGNNNGWWTNWTPGEENTFVCEGITAGDMEVIIGGGLNAGDSFELLSVKMEKAQSDEDPKDDPESTAIYKLTEADKDGEDWKATIPFAKLGVEGIKEGEKVNATVTYKPNTENSGATLIIFGNPNGYWTQWTPGEENTFVCEGITAGDMEVIIGSGLNAGDSLEILSVKMEKVAAEEDPKDDPESTAIYKLTEADKDGEDWKATIPFADLGVEGISEGEKVNATVTYKPNTENSGATLIIFGNPNGYWTQWTPGEENDFVCEGITAGDMEVIIGSGLNAGDSLEILSVKMEKVSETEPEEKELTLPYTMTTENNDGTNCTVTIPFAGLNVEGIQEGDTVNAVVTYKPNTEKSHQWGSSMTVFGQHTDWQGFTNGAENEFTCENILAGDLEFLLGGEIQEGESVEILSVKMEKVGGNEPEEKELTLPYTMTTENNDGTNCTVTIPFAGLNVEGIQEGDTVNAVVTYKPNTEKSHQWGSSMTVFGQHTDWQGFTNGAENEFTCENILAGDLEFLLGGEIQEGESVEILSVTMEKAEPANELSLQALAEEQEESDETFNEEQVNAEDSKEDFENRTDSTKTEEVKSEDSEDEESKGIEDEKSKNSENAESKDTETEESKAADTKESKDAETEESENTETKESKAAETEEFKDTETDESEDTETKEFKAAETEESKDTEIKESEDTEIEESEMTETEESKAAEAEDTDASEKVRQKEDDEEDGQEEEAREDEKNLISDRVNMDAEPVKEREEGEEE